jgi:hypothetical protein
MNRETAMKEIASFVDNYVAVWNEGDPTKRRQRIREVWGPEGTTCYRLMDARGYDAIEQRVVGSWEKWLSEGKHVFRPKSFAVHHNVIKLDFIMVRLPGEEVEASGLCFLLLDRDGRIGHDYQFNPSANDASELAKRYVALLNEDNAVARRNQISELWSPDCSFVNEEIDERGFQQVEQVFSSLRARLSDGERFASVNLSQAHHGVARIKWQMLDADGRPIEARSDLLVFDQHGRISADYQFREAAAD